MKLEKYEKGDVICYQGEESSHLYILVSGKLEILIAPPGSNLKDQRNIEKQSKRVGEITTPKTPFGEISFFLGTERNATIRAETNASVALIPAGKDAVTNLIKTNPIIGVQIAKTLLKKCLDTYNVIKKTTGILAKAAMYYDNFSLLYYKMNPNAQDKENPVYKRGIELIGMAKSSGAQLPKQLSLALLETDLCKNFGITYDTDLKSEIVLDFDLIELFKSFYKLPEKVTKICAKLSPYIIDYSSKKLSEFLKEMNGYFIEYDKKAEDRISKLCSNEGSLYAEYIRFLELVRDAKHPNFDFISKIVEKLTQIINDMSAMYRKLYNKEITDIHIEYKKRAAVFEEEAKKKAELAQSKKEADLIKASDLIFDDNFNRLADLKVVPDETVESLRNNLNEYKQLANKMETTGDGRKVKKNLAAEYWKFYPHIFKYYLDAGKNVESFVLLFLRYGILDDELLNSETTNGIKLVPMKTKSTFPIYYADEWLEKIYNEEVSCSMNPLGQTYEEVLKESGEDVSADPKGHMLNFETVEVIGGAVNTCAGMISNQIPMLDSDFITGDVKEKMLTKEKLEKVLKEIMALDFSTFYRETRIIVEGKAEFVQKEVIPNFIIVPVAGSKAVCWQELDGRNKSSQARIMVPLIPTEDIKTMLYTALAHCRWELSKTLAGAAWGDPVEGGLTGKYFDYCSTWKNSGELSDKVKEKIKEIFKKYPNTKDRYAYDYALWMEFESEGTLKLNKLTRDIFFEFVPFPRKIREKLAAMPQFEKVANRFENLRKKTVMQIQQKISKFEKDGITVPPEFHDHLEFYKK